MASPARVWLPILVLSGHLSATGFAHAAHYVVDGFGLGDRVATANPDYKTYSCKPGDGLADATRCERKQQRTVRGSTATVSNTLITAEDGTAIYLMAHAAPVALNRSIVQAEIDSLTREVGERPTKVDWQPAANGTPTTVVVVWGSIKLQETSEDLGSLPPGKDVLMLSVEGLPLYRISGGRGYVYCATFDASGKGQRHYVAIDASQLAERQYQAALMVILQKDQLLAKDDYKLWPDVAAITRELSLNTSPKTANDTLDKVFNKFPSKKLRSHVWSLLPGGAIERLGDKVYSRIDQYGPKTDHPDVRRDMLSFLAAKPSDPFIEFAYYIVGDFDKALAANPNTIIPDVLHYAIGYKIVQSLLQDTLKVAGAGSAPNASAQVKDQLKSLLDEGPEADYYVDDALRVSNQNPDLYGGKPLGDVVPNFAARAAAAQTHFEAVLRNPSSVHADDAAYMLGWLAFQQGKSAQALAYFSQAMTVGNGDYKPAAMKQTVRIIAQYPARQQFSVVESDRGFAQQPALWYVAARSAYRDFDFAQAIDIAQHALSALNVPVDRLPVTTDPDRIDAALEKVSPDLRADPNAVEIPYLIEAAKEISSYLAYLQSAATERPDVLAKRAKSIILKYSMLVEEKQQPGRNRLPPVLEHRDLRQALHMLDLTLAATPKDGPHRQLREWLHYRKVRILSVYRPQAVGDAVAAMAQEFPNSTLLDDALAEQIYAQGLILHDVGAAQSTFRKLLDTFPNGNAVDNAYSWMAIIYRCAGRVPDEQNINREIIRRFPLSRHARYARERMANPTGCHMSEQ